MDEAIAIILISVAMFLGCFLLGLIPLLIKLSEKRLQFVSIFGAGLLCGTALAIVLPEGVELLEESWRVSSCSVAPAAANQNASDGGVGGQLQEMGPSSKGLPARFFIGVSLVVGFILMFLVDQISSYCSIHETARGPDKHALRFDTLNSCAVCFSLLLQSGGSPQHRLSATGVGMLFSAGTFLYVATVHVLPEISSRGQQSSPHLHGTGTGQQGVLGVLESLTLILGAGLPVLLALGLRDD
ncbi:zinc transporter ZIP9 [Salvelinus sp. IW2-2015]|uniref:zinc transporter ZIP9 n=1 Tax=Salvelinus sp. IW2-2015 TaxID=2691554 RepID=UPI0038D49623